MKRVKKICPSSLITLYDAGGDLSRRWFVHYKAVDGSRVRIYKGINRHKDQAGRIAAAKAIIQELRLLHPYLGTPSLVRHLWAYIAHKKNQLRTKTRQCYESRTRLFQRWYLGGQFSFLDAELFLDSLLSAGKSATYRNDLRTYFISVFDWLVKTRRWPENPFRETSPIKSASYTPYRYFQPNQARLLRVELKEEKDLWLFCQLIYYCFIRPGELRGLKVSDVLLDVRKILVRSEISKNHKQEYVHIPAALFSSLEEYLELARPGDFLFCPGGQPGPGQIGINTMSKRHRKILRRLGFGPGFVLYSWKHTGAVQFIRNGGSIKALQLQLRHHSLDQVDQYLRGLGVSDLPDIDSFPAI